MKNSQVEPLYRTWGNLHVHLFGGTESKTDLDRIADLFDEDSEFRFPKQVKYQGGPVEGTTGIHFSPFIGYQIGKRNETDSPQKYFVIAESFDKEAGIKKTHQLMEIMGLDSVTPDKITTEDAEPVFELQKRSYDKLLIMSSQLGFDIEEYMPAMTYIKSTIGGGEDNQMKIKTVLKERLNASEALLDHITEFINHSRNRM